MFNRKFILFILILFILSIGSVSASDNLTDDDYTQINNHFEDDSLSISDESSLQSTITVSGNTFEDIDDAINNAKKNDVIKLNGIYTGSAGSIYVDKDLTLDGGNNKATLDAKNSSSIILTAPDVKVTLKNINFKNSNSFAAILNGGIVENCNFENNYYAISAGDSISNNELIVKNSVFSNNGGGIYAILKKLSVEKCTFINNKGTAIETDLINYSYVNIKDSKFSGNSADWGAAIYMYLKHGSATISNCEFNNNIAKKAGGAIYFSADEDYKIDVLSSTFNSNSAKQDSAISIRNSQSNIKNNIFINNNADEEILNSIGTLPANSVLKNNLIKSVNSDNENLKLEVLNTPAYYGDVYQIKFTKNGSPLANKKISAIALKDDGYTLIEFENVTDLEGIAKFAFSSQTDYINVGVWNIEFIADSGNTKIVESANNLDIKKVNAEVVLNSISATYASGEIVKLRIINKNTGESVGNIGLFASVYKNGFYVKDLKLVTNIDGTTNIKISDLNVGEYKVEISSSETSDQISLDKNSANIKITKAQTKVSAPKVTNKYKKSKYFKVTVKDKKTNKSVKNLKLKVKVYTGKKYKTYSITTKNGVAKLNTKSIAKGTHKVIISSGNSNYKVSAKSTIKIN